MALFVFDNKNYEPEKLFPFSLTMKVQDMPVGMLTIRKKWTLLLGAPVMDETDIKHANEDKILIPSNLLPSVALATIIKKMQPGDKLVSDNGDEIIIAIPAIQDAKFSLKRHTIRSTAIKKIEYGWNIFQYNREAIAEDFDLLTKGKKSTSLPDTNFITASKNIFVEDGAEIKFAFINASEGPVYIAKGALIMEGAAIRGPVYIGEKAVIKMRATIYGATTIGYRCTIGGEVKNTVIFPYSNKAHDGYLGDAVIGNWCNLGGGTSNSNIKNTAGNIKVPLPSGTVIAGVKCGVLMGDYTKTAINTSLSSGTVTGICAHIFGAGLSPKFIPSFSWNTDKYNLYNLPNALEHIQRWKALKGEVLHADEKELITTIYKQTKKN